MNKVHFLQFTQVFSVFFTLAVFVLPISASAFFGDVERSPEQRFVASELQLDVSLEQTELMVGVAKPSPHTDVVISLTEQSLAAKYDIAVVGAVGNVGVCDSLELTLKSEAQTLREQASTFASGELNELSDWEMLFTADNLAGLVHGESCTFEFLVTAWQNNMSKATAGYRDTKTGSLTVFVSQVVLNEVLPKPEIGEKEFIELYNNSDVDVDVAGWEIQEFTNGGAPTSHAIVSVGTQNSDMVAYDGSGSTVVPAHGFLALTYFGEAPYLNNDGDTVRLVDGQRLLGEYSFGVAITGKSDARIPDGVGNWIDPIPTPNETNVIDSASLQNLSILIAPVVEPVQESEISVPVESPAEAEDADSVTLELPLTEIEVDVPIDEHQEPEVTTNTTPVEIEDAPLTTASPEESVVEEAIEPEDLEPVKEEEVDDEQIIAVKPEPESEPKDVGPTVVSEPKKTEEDAVSEPEPSDPVIE